MLFLALDQFHSKASKSGLHILGQGGSDFMNVQKSEKQLFFADGHASQLLYALGGTFCKAAS